MAKRRANGEGSIYKRKDGTWTAQYTDCTGKVRYLYGKTQQIVKEKLKEAINQNDKGIVINDRKISLSDWVKEWLEVYHKPVVRPSTYQKDYRNWKMHIQPYWGRVQLKNVRQDALQKFLNGMLETRTDGKEGGYSIGFVAEIKVILYGALEKAVEFDYIPRNPAAKLKLPTRNTKEKQVFTPEQQKTFEKAVRAEMEQNHNHSIFLLMLYTGMRVGEALGLRIGDIDFEKRELTIKRTVGVFSRAEAQEQKMEFYEHKPKTIAGKRMIPISPAVEEILREQIKYRNHLVDMLSDKWDDMSTAGAGYLYLSSQGKVLYAVNLNKKLRQIVGAAGLPHMSVHGLRHTFATRWLEAGLDVKSLSEILGHADASITLNVYTHSIPEQKRKNMEAMGSLFGKTE